RKTFLPNSYSMGANLCGLGLAKLRTRAFAEAEPLLREGIAILDKASPDGLPTFWYRSDLGAALVGQKKYDEAETLLQAGYAGLKQREKPIAPGRRYRLPETVDRLIELYTATNKPDEVKKWRQERAIYADVIPLQTEKK